MKIRPFIKEDIKSVSELLSYRHRKERKFFKELSTIYEDSKMTEKVIIKYIDKFESIGVVAEENGKIVGYLLSQLREDNLFGRCAWIKYEGMAIAEEMDKELYREMYEFLAKRWVELGYLKHIIFVPTGDKNIINAWLQLGFSYEQAYGVKNLDCVNSCFDKLNRAKHNNILSDVIIRLATKEDRENLKSISNLILSYQAKSPVFAIAPPEMFNEIEKGFGGLVEDDEAYVLLAYQNEKLLGYCCGYFEEAEEDIMAISKSFELSVAGTNPLHQSKGIGTMLVQKLFQDAKEKNYKYSVADWRITNLKASKFWPKVGYKPYAYRMTRTIDARILWANGDKKEFR